jgi:hypothetical protein
MASLSFFFLLESDGGGDGDVVVLRSGDLPESVFLFFVPVRWESHDMTPTDLLLVMCLLGCDDEVCVAWLCFVGPLPPGFSGHISRLLSFCCWPFAVSREKRC